MKKLRARTYATILVVCLKCIRKGTWVLPTKVQLAQEKSHSEHRSSNILNSGENGPHDQTSVAQE